MTTHYTTLGITENASDDHIRQAYEDLYRRARADPKCNQHPNTFIRINEAFNTLISPRKRRIYDAQIAALRAGASRLSVKEVDTIVYSLLRLHDPDINLDIDQFLDLIKHSLCLDVEEKKRVIDSVPKMSQHHVDALIEVFLDERSRVSNYDTSRAIKEQQEGWLILGYMYREGYQ